MTVRKTFRYNHYPSSCPVFEMWTQHCPQGYLLVATDTINFLSEPMLYGFCEDGTADTWRPARNYENIVPLTRSAREFQKMAISEWRLNHKRMLE